MRELFPHLSRWLAGEPFALATVVATSGSAPRAPGACLLVSADGRRFTGSVSSGCLEQEVVAAALEVLRKGGVRRLRFGPDGQPPWHDGLTCGGWIEVRVEPWWHYHERADVRRISDLVRSWLANDTAGVVLSGETHHLALADTGELFGDREAFAPELIDAARAQLATEGPSREIPTAAGPVFLRSVRRRSRLLLIGATDVAAALAASAREHDFGTTVIDPRRDYAVPERFHVAPKKLVHAWPQQPVAEFAPTPCDAAIALTHDPKIDDVALQALLATDCGYIGALGSSRSHALRLERLREAGCGDAALQRIHGPAGLHLATPDASGIALGILAGVAQWRAARDRGGA